MHLKGVPITSCAEMQFINTLELAALRAAVPGSQRELAAEVVEVNREFAQAYKLLAR